MISAFKEGDYFLILFLVLIPFLIYFILVWRINYEKERMKERKERRRLGFEIRLYFFSTFAFSAVRYFLLRALRVLRGDDHSSFLVTALPRYGSWRKS